MDENIDIKLRVMVVGDHSVGKTCLIRRYAENVFSEDYISTVGVDFSAKTMEIPVQTREGPSELKLRYMIYDIGSQNQYNNRIETYAPQTMVFVICYDITQPSSLENTLTWEMKIKEFTEKLAQSKGFTIPQTFVLVGTKRDLDPDKQYRGRRHHVTEKQLNEIFTESQFTNTIETSAKTGENVKELFETYRDYSLQ